MDLRRFRQLRAAGDSGWQLGRAKRQSVGRVLVTVYLLYGCLFSVAKRRAYFLSKSFILFHIIDILHVYYLYIVDGYFCAICLKKRIFSFLFVNCRSG